MGLRILQINAKNSKNVAADLRALALGKNIDIILLQEPYTYKGKVKGYGLANRVLQCTEAEVPKSAIIILNTEIEVTQISQFTSSHSVCVYVVSVYKYGGRKFLYCINILSIFS